MSRQDEVPGVLLPPPLLFLAFFWLAASLQSRWPWPLDGPVPLLRILAVLGLGAAFSLAVGALGWFKQSGTDPRPWKPTTALVVRGPYRWTRNPMYLAMTLLFQSWGLWNATCWCLALLPALIEVVNRAVIFREERYLAARFGQSYRDYRRRVRRWL